MSGAKKRAAKILTDLSSSKYQIPGVLPSVCMRRMLRRITLLIAQSGNGAGTQAQCSAQGKEKEKLEWLTFFGSCYLETGSHCVAQADLGLAILLLHS